MKAKKILSVLIALIMAFGLTACDLSKLAGKNSRDSKVEATEETEETEAAEETDETEETEATEETESTEATETSDETRATEETKKTRETKANTAGLSDDLFAFQIVANGKVFILPCKVADFAELGLYLDEDEKDEIIESNYYTYTSVSNEEYDRISISLYNMGKTDLTFEECTVYDITLSKTSAENIEMSFVKGITYGFTTEQIREIYGEPSDEYVSDDGKYIYLTYEEEGEGYYNNEIEFNFSDNELYEIHLAVEPE